jgi:DNA modification methylase
MTQGSLDLTTQIANSIECFGQTFIGEEARREHFLKLLAEKLKDPEFRKIEGFPIGTDEDILALSDPPYYTACPNPWVGDFLRRYGTTYDPKQLYHREPFAADVSEGKNHPIYNAHSYHTKVPHRAIMRYILHYTEPGEVIFDGFAGTGMAGVAAQLCGDRTEVQELGYQLRSDGTVLDEDGRAFTKIGARRAILNDLSPAATLIASGLNLSADAMRYMSAARELVRKVQEELPGIYETRHSGWKVRERKTVAHKQYPRRTAEPGDVEFTLYSDVLSCPECNTQNTYYDIAVNKQEDSLNEAQACPACHAALSETDWKPVIETVFDPVLGATTKRNRLIPVLINYSIGTQRFEKVPDDGDAKRFESAEKLATTKGFGAIPLIDGRETQRNVPIGISHLHQFFTPVEHIFAASLLHNIQREEDAEIRRLLTLAFTAMVPYTSRMRRFRADRKGGGPLSGTLYVSSLVTPLNVGKTFLRNAETIAASLTYSQRSKSNCALTTQSATQLAQIPDGSVDYIFIDPPFGFNFDYSELNFFWEGFLGVKTAQEKEAIISDSQGKDLRSYGELMKAGFVECFRVLKPGRWMTVEFSNTLASVWNSIQTTLQEAGFVVANVAALDKKQGSFKAVTTTTAVKQDLVISAYKPNDGLEERFARRGETEEGVWDFIKTHLKNLPVVKARGGQLEPIVERDPRILYDRMVAFYVGHSTPVPLSSGEFQAALAEKFPVRDDMYFLPGQVNEYDKKRQQMQSVGQLSIFVEDEKSAIHWLRNELKDKPQTYQEIQPSFMRQLGASWKKWERHPELSALLNQNFLRYDGTGDVPSQLHSYLSTQFKGLRNLPKDHPQLRYKGKDRWYVPDPKKNIDVEKLRNKRLLEEFWTYLPAGYAPPALNPTRGDNLPGLIVPVPKIPKGKKLKELRTEAVRVGFKHCYQQKDYQTILVIGDMLPESVIQEDEALQMYYDTAVTRTEEV